jgi:hypothetical protein
VGCSCGIISTLSANSIIVVPGPIALVLDARRVQPAIKLNAKPKENKAIVIAATPRKPNIIWRRDPGSFLVVHDRFLQLEPPAVLLAER